MRALGPLQQRPEARGDGGAELDGDMQIDGEDMAAEAEEEAARRRRWLATPSRGEEGTPAPPGGGGGGGGGRLLESELEVRQPLCWSHRTHPALHPSFPPLLAPPRPLTPAGCAACRSAEFRASAAVRAASFYTYPTDRSELARRAHFRMKVRRRRAPHAHPLPFRPCCVRCALGAGTPRTLPHEGAPPSRPLRAPAPIRNTCSLRRVWARSAVCGVAHESPRARGVCAVCKPHARVACAVRAAVSVASAGTPRVACVDTLSVWRCSHAR
jgi:hypothetical protein